MRLVAPVVRASGGGRYVCKYYPCFKHAHPGLECELEVCTFGFWFMFGGVINDDSKGEVFFVLWRKSLCVGFAQE